MINNNNTICAISTAPGVGGIAVIRVSGKDAFEICDKIFVSAKNIKLAEQKGYTIHFGQIVKERRHCGLDPQSSEKHCHSDESQSPLAQQEIAGQARNDSYVVDEVLVSVFRAPHSFTGENCVEIACHGSLFIQQEILQLLLANGAVLALPGEFTQRAFLNGKMDLSQAEAVADLIASTSASAHQMALNQMRGGFSNELSQLRMQLLNFVSLVELELDFSEEDVEFADRTRLKELAAGIEKTIAELADSFKIGNVLKNGIPVAIVGETNVGKSTLLNVLLNEDKAIVSDIHGTTRDVIEDTVNIDGLMFRFIDTAGIRETKDTIENLGIERTYQKMKQASIVLWLVDSTQLNSRAEWITQQVVKHAKNKKIIIVFNKIDKIGKEENEDLKDLFKDIDAEKIYISAKKKISTEKLKKALVEGAKLPNISNNDVIVTNVRHYEALKNALTAIKRVTNGLYANISGDFLSQDIRECMHYLGEITGEISTDEVLGNIFEKFCIGK
jgi:tRNA modification GTPase